MDEIVEGKNFVHKLLHARTELCNWGFHWKCSKHIWKVWQSIWNIQISKTVGAKKTLNWMPLGTYPKMI